MRRIKLLVPLTVVFLLSAPAGRSASPEPIETTTEFGLTVTVDEVLDSMLELESFWPPVRSYLCGDRFQAADRETRREAVALLKQLDDQMSERLFNDDQAVGRDLFDYVAARLRKYEFLRRLWTTVGDDAAMISLKAEWDRALQEAYARPEAECPERLTANVARMRAAMRDAGVPDEKVDPAMELWDLLAQSTLRVDRTEAGRAAVAFERQIADAETEAARLAFRIMDAAEWALIARPEGEELSRRHFLAAWEALSRDAATPTAASGGQ